MKPANRYFYYYERKHNLQIHELWKKGPENLDFLEMEFDFLDSLDLSELLDTTKIQHTTIEQLFEDIQSIYAYTFIYVDTNMFCQYLTEQYGLNLVEDRIHYIL